MKVDEQMLLPQVVQLLRNFLTKVPVMSYLSHCRKILAVRRPLSDVDRRSGSGGTETQTTVVAAAVVLLLSSV